MSLQRIYFLIALCFLRSGSCVLLDTFFFFTSLTYPSPFGFYSQKFTLGMRLSPEKELCNFESSQPRLYQQLQTLPRTPRPPFTEYVKSRPSPGCSPVGLSASQQALRKFQSDPALTNICKLAVIDQMQLYFRSSVKPEWCSPEARRRGKWGVAVQQV